MGKIRRKIIEPHIVRKGEPLYFVILFAGKKLKNNHPGTSKVFELAERVVKKKINYLAKKYNLSSGELLNEYLHYLSLHLHKFQEIPEKNFWIEGFMFIMLNDAMSRIIDKHGHHRYRFRHLKLTNIFTPKYSEQIKMNYADAVEDIIFVMGAYKESSEIHINKKKPQYNPYGIRRNITEKMLYKYIRNNKIKKADAEKLRKKLKDYNLENQFRSFMRGLY